MLIKILIIAIQLTYSLLWHDCKIRCKSIWSAYISFTS